MPDFNPNRDRIVILGRRRSGKTIFMAMLYELLRNNDDPHMRALDGRTHEDLLKIVDSLKNQQWPAATGGNTESKFEITFKGQIFTLVLLDYPGEVFRRAFIEDIKAPDTNALREHVDKASGVICLIDPGNLLDGTVEERSDDEFGMTQALYRVRRSAGGGGVPIAIVLTKWDLHMKRVKRMGTTKFFRKFLNNLSRIDPPTERFPCSAVRSIQDAGDRDVPDTSREPQGVVEPLIWVLNHILIRQQSARVLEQRRIQEDQQRQAHQAAVETEFVQKRRMRRFWFVFIILMALIAALAIGTAIWWVATGQSSGTTPEVAPSPVAAPVDGS
ncbi:MAG: hypothetical protein MK085_12195 [Phycisphaerales bacterium]|nr:hypothetical protein [Phycisphaerales bacterium]